MRKILVISKGIFHPTVFCRRLLRNILQSSGNAFEFTSKIDKLDGLDAKLHYAVVLFLHEKTISAPLVKALVAFVNDGGRLFCLHGSLASFKSSEEYVDLTGARFTGHDAVGEMKLEGDAYFTIKDELYEFKISDECNVKMHCRGIPVYWTRRQGNGIVACLSPGHRAGTFRNSEFKNLIKSILINDIGVSGGNNE